MQMVILIISTLDIKVFRSKEQFMGIVKGQNNKNANWKNSRDVETYRNKLKNISNSYYWKKKKRLANAVHFSEWVIWVVEFLSRGIKVCLMVSMK